MNNPPQRKGQQLQQQQRGPIANNKNNNNNNNRATTGKPTFAKASLVGATTVKGPSPERVSASPAASTKSTSCVAPGGKV